MKIGILKADSVREEWVPRFGEYPHMFIELLGSRDAGLQFTIYDVEAGELPSGVDAEDAYLITGSKFSVYDSLPWIEPLETFVRALHAARRKLIGICFGHQLIAQALGGKVEKARVGWGVGLHRHRFFRHPQWMDDGDSEFPVLVSHQDQVTRPAAEMERLAGSDFCPYAVCQVGKHILTLQGHPEFVPEYSREIMRFRREMIGEQTYFEGMESLVDAPATERMAQWLLAFLHSDESPEATTQG